MGIRWLCQPVQSYPPWYKAKSSSEWTANKNIQDQNIKVWTNYRRGNLYFLHLIIYTSFTDLVKLLRTTLPFHWLLMPPPPTLEDPNSSTLNPQSGSQPVAAQTITVCLVNHFNNTDSFDHHSMVMYTYNPYSSANYSRTLYILEKYMYKRMV